MRKLSPTQRNLLKPIFIVLWPVVVPLNIAADLIGSLTGNRNHINVNPMNDIQHGQRSNLNWFDALGNEVFGFNDFND